MYGRLKNQFGGARVHEQSCAAGVVKGGAKGGRKLPFCNPFAFKSGVSFEYALSRKGLPPFGNPRWGMKDTRLEAEDARASVKAQAQGVEEEVSKTMHEMKVWHIFLIYLLYAIKGNYYISGKPH